MIGSHGSRLVGDRLPSGENAGLWSCRVDGSNFVAGDGSPGAARWTRQMFRDLVPVGVGQSVPRREKAG